MEWIESFGTRFSNVSFDEAVEEILRMAAGQAPRFAVTPNVDHIVRIQRDAEMASVYRAADLALCDSAPVLWAMRWLGRPLKERAPGSDLFPVLCGRCAARGLRPFLLGASPGVADECARRLTMLHPNLQIAGTCAPPMGFEENPEEEKRIIEAVRSARPDLLFVAFGTPRQEKFIHRNLAAMNVSMSIGVGAAFDFYAGASRRAPAWMRRCGMEWLWRLAREPRRLYRRYLIDDLKFFGIVWRERLKNLK
ncbi:MAG: WecB/TagA/CpsF family glycosyltransferase [Candidatus Sumerlaeota bacterium]|nr:WecB/TagA/CpsF family glycosyltransferase [Candidatus Sumerlaeota bacterium]